MLYWAYESWSERERERERGEKRKGRQKWREREKARLGEWCCHYKAFQGVKGNDPVKRGRESGRGREGGGEREGELPLCSAGWVSLIQLNRALEDKVNQKPSSLNRTSDVAANSIRHLGWNSLPYYYNPQQLYRPLMLWLWLTIYMRV